MRWALGGRAIFQVVETGEAASGSQGMQCKSCWKGMCDRLTGQHGRAQEPTQKACLHGNGSVPQGAAPQEMGPGERA